MTPVNSPNLPEAHGGDIFRFGQYILSPSKRTLRSGEVEVLLGARALDLLVLLVRRAGEIVPKREIYDFVWEGLHVDETNLRAQVAHLRAVLGDHPEIPAYIVTVRGRGYVFAAPVKRVAAPFEHLSADGRSAVQKRLPRRVQRILGREEVLAELITLLGTKRLISIVGPGGVGKTALAVEAGHRLTHDFRYDLCFIDLGSLSNENLILPTVASSLGYAIDSRDVESGLVANLLHRDVILILDCCEHLLDAVCRLASTLISGAPGVRIVATSREALRAVGEYVLPLGPLDVPAAKEDLSVQEATAASSVRLFMERASSRGCIAELHDMNAPLVAKICRQLDGNPLAIEMVASRLPTYGFAGLLDALAGRSVLHWPGERNETRHQTLQSTLDWSFQLLSLEEQCVLARLSILSGPFSMAAAQAIATSAEDEAWSVVRAVEGLSDKSLLATTVAEGRHWFRMLDVTRLYARLKLAESENARAVAARHAKWCAGDIASDHLIAADDAALDHKCAERSLGNIHAALEWCFGPDGDTGIGVRLAAHASKTFLDLSMHAECVRWCEMALGKVGGREDVVLPVLKLQQHLALSLMYTAGNHDRVGEAIDRGLAMATQLNDRDVQLHMLAGYNLYHTRRDDLPKALDAAERFAAIAHEGDSASEAAAADWMLGSTYHLIGHEIRGEELLERGYARFAVGSRQPINFFGFGHEGRAAISRAWIAWLRGRPDKAIEFARQAIEMADANNHPVSSCIAYLYIAWTTLWLRDLSWTEALNKRLSVLACKYQLKPYLTGSTAIRGELLLARGRASEAVDVLGGVLGEIRSERQNIVLVPTLRAYAEALARSGEVARAESVIAELVERVENVAPTYYLPELLRSKGDVALARGLAGHAEAELHFQQALNQARTNGALGWELRAGVSLARLWADKGSVRDARQLLQGIFSQFTEGYTTADLVEAKALLCAWKE